PEGRAGAGGPEAAPADPPARGPAGGALRGGPGELDLPGGPRRLSEDCLRLTRFEEYRRCRSRIRRAPRRVAEQDLPPRCPRPGLSAAPFAPGLAPRGPPGLLPARYRRRDRPGPDLRPLRARDPRPAPVPPPDDGHPAAVLLRHRHPLRAQDHGPLPDRRRL